MESTTADEVLERIMATVSAPALSVRAGDESLESGDVAGVKRALLEVMSAISSVLESLEGLESLESFGSDGPAADARDDVLFPSDPLRRRKDHCLDRLAGIAKLEARTAAEKARVLAELVSVAAALDPPSLSPQEATAQEMSLVAEVACALTVSERTALSLLAESLALTTALPLTLSALQAGEVSWQHARVMVDETTNLDPAGAAALEAHFLDPGAPDPARGCPAGELVPSRFRHKAREPVKLFV